MKAIRPLLLTSIIAGCIPQTNAQIIINELMQSNIDCIMDDLNEFPDSWLELHNPTTSPVSLAGYSVCNKNKPSKAYALPAKTIPAGGYMIVYCDKQGEGLHADFRLESGKDGAIYLFKDGVVVDMIEGMKKQPAPNIAYGRQTDGSDTWGYMATPTPGASNCGRIIKDILGEPIFSTPGRVSTDPLQLTISLPADAPEGTTVHYTTDGTEPTASSPTANGAIRIDKTTTIRAVAMCDGYLTPRSTVQSYIFFPREMTLPIVSMVTDDRYFSDPKIGIYAGENYLKNWRRPVNIELFEKPGEESVINQLCETRIKGGATRTNPLKSLAIYANKRFGTKRFFHEFFPEDAPGRNEWKSFELRNSGNDFDYLYFRDALIQRIMGRNTDLDWQPWQPVIYMLNGEYKGILNIRPRSNEDHIYTFYDELEDIDMFENWWELKEGSWDNYNAFKEFYSGHGHTLAEYEQWMDTGEFANLVIMNLFYDNKDFPANNIVMWRPIADGGRWRWIAKDADFGLGLYGRTASYNTIAWINDNNYDQDFAWGNTWEGTRLFRRLMEIDEFKQMFIDRCAVYVGDFLNAQYTNNTLDEMRNVIAYEYPYHRKLFNEWWPNYNEEVSFIKRWIGTRTPAFLTFVADYYKLGKPLPLTIDKGRKDILSLTVNGIPVNNRSFNGKFFQGRDLNISGSTADDTKAIAGWKVTVTNGTSSTTTEYPGPELHLTFPSCTSVDIQSMISDSGIKDISVGNAAIDPDETLTVYDLSGRCLGTYPSLSSAMLARGIYVLKQGSSAAKHLVR